MHVDTIVLEDHLVRPERRLGRWVHGGARAAIESRRMDGAPEDASLDDPFGEVRLLVRACPAKGEELTVCSHEYASRVDGGIDAKSLRHALHDVF
jgi:hypothetical protein